MHSRAIPLALFLVACGSSDDLSDSGQVIDQGAPTDMAGTIDQAAQVITSIAVTPSSATILVGDTQVFVATATYSDATQQDVSSSVTWSASSALATISASGTASGVSAGDLTITASQGGVVSTPATLLVRSVSSITVTWPGGGVTPTTTIAGASVPFTATAQLSDATMTNVTTRAVWTSSMTNIATVNGSGVAIPGNSGGVSTISAMFAGKTGSASLLVQ